MFLTLVVNKNKKPTEGIQNRVKQFFQNIFIVLLPKDY